MITICKRNLKVFFRDKSSVFFSLLAVFIIIGLYVLFLGDTITSGMKDVPNARFLMDSWIMAGLLAVTSITTTMGAFGIMIEDKTRKIEKDFLTAPIKRSQLVGGYILSSFVIGLIMTLITFVLAEVYIVAYGGEILPIESIFKVLGLIVLSVLTGSSMVLFMVSFFKSQNAFATASTILGTLIGFLTGIYIPIGSLPEAVQYVIKVFPISHAGALFRQIMMEVPMSTAFANAPESVIANFKNTLGVTYKFGDYVACPTTSILVLCATVVIFYCLAILNISRKKR